MPTADSRYQLGLPKTLARGARRRDADPRRGALDSHPDCRAHLTQIVALHADPESLTVRGWQHAGALAAVFAGPGSGAADALVARPDVIFAAGAGKKKARIGGKEVEVGSHSRRPLQTVTLLAEALKLAPVTTHTKGEEQALVDDALGRPGTVLICWQHQNIAAIGNLIIGNNTTVPQSWPEDRYDLIYVFDRAGDAWSFRQFFHERLVTS